MIDPIVRPSAGVAGWIKSPRNAEFRPAGARTSLRPGSRRARLLLDPLDDVKAVAAEIFVVGADRGVADIQGECHGGEAREEVRASDRVGGRLHLSVIREPVVTRDGLVLRTGILGMGLDESPEVLPVLDL